MTQEQNAQAEQPEVEPKVETEQADHTAEDIAEEVSIEDLKSQLNTLAEELKLQKARTANTVYEAEKTKERLEREADTAKKFALEKFAKSLLDSVDNLERAIQAGQGEQSAVLEGVELTLKSLIKTLEAHGVVEVDTTQGFNADFHQAVGIAPDAKANEIGTVLQKGYTLSGRLLRPAMVLVGQ